MKFKLYEEFLNESLDRNLERATELAILFTLRQLLPDGGNNMYGEQIDWEKLDPMFPSIGPKNHPFQGGGPDLYINFDEEDARQFSEEFNTLYNVMNMTHSSIHDEIDNKFQEYGLQIEELSPGENIVHVAIPKLKKGAQEELSPEDLEFIVNFYKTREQKIKDLETKYKLALTSKKYGL